MHVIPLHMIPIIKEIFEMRYQIFGAQEKEKLLIKMVVRD